MEKSTPPTPDNPDECQEVYTLLHAQIVNMLRKTGLTLDPRYFLEGTGVLLQYIIKSLGVEQLFFHFLNKGGSVLIIDVEGRIATTVTLFSMPPDILEIQGIWEKDNCFFPDHIIPDEEETFGKLKAGQRWTGFFFVIPGTRKIQPGIVVEFSERNRNTPGEGVVLAEPTDGLLTFKDLQEAPKTWEAIQKVLNELY